MLVEWSPDERWPICRDSEKAGTAHSDHPGCFRMGLVNSDNRVRCWRALGARVIAVEPQPDFQRVLRLLYGRDEHVALVNAAVGRARGHATLLVSERTPLGIPASEHGRRDLQTKKDNLGHELTLP